MAELVHEWNVWETQTLVFISFMLQLFLLATGSLRRRKTNGVLKALIWLAYVGADSVAVYALGLFSQYEDRYKLGNRESFGDTLPFLWVPFLLVHLGGQDTITAFSIEDNNLWLRHLLNLATQVVLALYVFWKSFYRISYSILVPAMLVFVSGIIKYGERVWALKSVSRNGLGQSAKLKSPPGQNNGNNVLSKESYALQTVLLARGLFVGRTVPQLGAGNREKLVGSFRNYAQGEERLKIVVMELGMMFDLLYTKANVLQRWTGVRFRCAAQILVVVAFVLFIRSEMHSHQRVNVSISYTLFLGAILMECICVGMVIWSPWTRAHFKVGCHCGYNKQWLLSNPIGQFSYMDWSFSERSTAATVMRKVIGALGMEQQWRNLWHIKHVEAKDMVEHIAQWFNARPQEEWFTGFQIDTDLKRKLNYTLSLPFEHALYRLHIYTDLHLSRHFASDRDVRPLKEDCEMLSNYLMYLMVEHPSMLPVSTAAEDVGPELLKWAREDNQGAPGTDPITTKLDFLERYAEQKLPTEEYSRSPFEPPADRRDDRDYLRRSLEQIREMWVRLLIYAAGKCPGEVHARQLANGGELLTFVWLLMVHHGLGDVATELTLMTSDDPSVPEVGSIEAVEDGSWRPRQGGPRYAFDFRRHQHSRQADIQHARLLLQIAAQVSAVGQSVAPDGARVMMAGACDLNLIEQYLSADGETEQDDGGATAPGGASAVQDEAGTSGTAGQDDNAATVDDQDGKTPKQIERPQQ